MQHLRHCLAKMAKREVHLEMALPLELAGVPPGGLTGSYCCTIGPWTWCLCIKSSRPQEASGNFHPLSQTRKLRQGRGRVIYSRSQGCERCQGCRQGLHRLHLETRKNNTQVQFSGSPLPSFTPKGGEQANQVNHPGSPTREGHHSSVLPRVLRGVWPQFRGPANRGPPRAPHF